MRGRYCPEGEFPPRSLPCPPGHFCPLGSVAPTKCSPLAICPAGARYAYFFAGLLAAVLADTLVGCMLLFHHCRRQKAQKSAFALSIKAEGDELDAIEQVVQMLAKARQAHNTVAPEICFEGLTSTLPSGKVVFANLSGEIKAQSVTAVMGPSGAGKTCFLDALLKRARVPTTGRVQCCVDPNDVITAPLSKFLSSCFGLQLMSFVPFSPFFFFSFFFFLSFSFFLSFFLFLSFFASLFFTTKQGELCSADGHTAVAVHGTRGRVSRGAGAVAACLDRPAGGAAGGCLAPGSRHLPCAPLSAG